MPCYYSCKFVTFVADISLGVFVYPVKLFQHLFNWGARLFYDFMDDPYSLRFLLSNEDFRIYHMHQVPHEELPLKPFQSPPVDL